MDRDICRSCVTSWSGLIPSLCLIRKKTQWLWFKLVHVHVTRIWATKNKLLRLSRLRERRLGLVVRCPSLDAMMMLPKQMSRCRDHNCNRDRNCNCDRDHDRDVKQNKCPMAVNVTVNFKHVWQSAQDRTIAAHDDLLLEDSVQRLRGVYCWCYDTCAQNILLAAISETSWSKLYWVTALRQSSGDWADIPSAIGPSVDTLLFIEQTDKKSQNCA